MLWILREVELINGNSYISKLKRERTELREIRMKLNFLKTLMNTLSNLMPTKDSNRSNLHLQKLKEENSSKRKGKRHSMENLINEIVHNL